MSNKKPLTFRVSSALKNIIGQDLITDDYVAVFELVKNSIDAYATKIILRFEKDKIIVADNGKGMSSEDITNKWLVLAFSAKNEGEEENEYSKNFRDRIKVRRDSFAGNKGVGRFSCDRLGAYLNLQCKIDKPLSMVSGIRVDWEKFEEDAHQEFVSIPVEDFILPNFEFQSFKSQPHGTVLTISKLRASWDREKLLKLKEYLAKLIDPFGVDKSVEIIFDAPDELKEDDEIEQEKKEDFLADLLPPSHFRKIVNGSVENFIFETLENKTTLINVTFSDNGQDIHTTLVDRGELVYEITEPNPYPTLKALNGSAKASCKLFYLNTAAKRAFNSAMKVHATQYGNVFLFHNNFRVYPIGEPGNDAFRLDQRKAQGYARFLGTREILGRLDVHGSQQYFRESSSRDKGLLDTKEYLEVEKFFLEHCIKRLEAYVVGVTWQDKEDAETETTERVKSNEGRGRVIEVVSKLVKGKDVKLVRYGSELISIVDERSESFTQAINGLRFIAEKSKDRNLENQIKLAEQKWQNMLIVQKAKEEQLEKERKAREQAEKEAQKANAEKVEAQKAYEEEKKRNLFLAASSSLDYDTILNLHHQIYMITTNMDGTLRAIIKKILEGKASNENVIDKLQSVTIQNEEVITISKFATKANFRLDSNFIREDLVNYFDSYIQNVSQPSHGTDIKISIVTNNIVFESKFQPIQISIIIENLLTNSLRAKAKSASFIFEEADADYLQITYFDDGKGLDKSITEPERIFEKGFTTSSGSGLGLYHIKNILAEDNIKGSIQFDKTFTEGIKFIIRIRKNEA
jgi:signal transduction histidine kinase